MIFLKSFSVLTKPKIDIPSIIFSTIGFGGLIFGICSIENMGFWNATVFVSLLCGIVGLLAFSKRQLALKQPMLELRAFRYQMFSFGASILFISFMMPFAVNIILPTYIQSVLGLTTFAAGLALLPGCILNIIVAPMSGRLFDKIGARPLLFVGFCGFSDIDVLFISYFRVDNSNNAYCFAGLYDFGHRFDFHSHTNQFIKSSSQTLYGAWYRNFKYHSADCCCFRFFIIYRLNGSCAC